MSISKFLSFNKSCPVCSEPLTLFMQQHGSTLWRAKATGVVNTYTFTPFKFPKDKVDDFTLISDKDSAILTSSASIMAEAKKLTMHFFYLCNEGGIDITSESSYDYEINLYKGCYYRSSADMEFKKNDDKQWNMSEVREDGKDIVSQEESFSFKKNLEPDLERVYMLSIKTLEGCTDLWFYETSAEQRAQESYEPKLFEKKMPLLKTRPKFDIKDRDKLLSRLDSWILIS